MNIYENFEKIFFSLLANFIFTMVHILRTREREDFVAK